MAYQLYTKNQLGEIVAVTPGIDERVSNLETKAIELDNYKVDVREQTLKDEQKEQLVKNLDGTFLPLSGGTMTGGISFDPSKETIEIGFPYASGKGAMLSFRNKSYSGGAGGFDICAKANGTEKILSGRIDGSLTWGGLAVCTINTYGDRWIRFDNGLQVCWGSSASNQNVTIPVPFRDKDSYAPVAMTEVAAGSNQEGYAQGVKVSGTRFYIRVRSPNGTINSDYCNWILAGWWK